MASSFLSNDQQNFECVTIASVDFIKLPLIDILESHIRPVDLGREIILFPALTTGKNKLRQDQLNLCFPQYPTEPKYSNFDVTLLYTLIRNLCPSLKPTRGWGTQPDDADIQIGDDIERLRLFRNNYYAHADSAAISDTEFQDVWSHLKSIINRMQSSLGCSVDYEQELLKIERVKYNHAHLEEYKRILDGYLYLRKETDDRDGPEISIKGEDRVIFGRAARFEANVRNADLSCWQITWELEKHTETGKQCIDTKTEKYSDSTKEILNIKSVCLEDEGKYQAVLSQESYRNDYKVSSNSICLHVLKDTRYQTEVVCRIIPRHGLQKCYLKVCLKYLINNLKHPDETWTKEKILQHIEDAITTLEKNNEIKLLNNFLQKLRRDKHIFKTLMKCGEDFVAMLLSIKQRHNARNILLSEGSLCVTFCFINESNLEKFMQKLANNDDQLIKDLSRIILNKTVLNIFNIDPQLVWWTAATARIHLDLQCYETIFPKLIVGSPEDFSTVEKAILRKDEPLQIIHIVSSKKTNGEIFQELKVNDENLLKIMLHPDVKDNAVMIVSIAGAIRKGKSFLLGFFLKYLEAKMDANWLNKDDLIEGFEWRRGTDRVTRGIQIWSKPFLFKSPSNEKVAILLMDTEGVFDCASTKQDCANIFTLSSLISSVQIYNLMHQIQDDDMEVLEYFSEFGKLIQEKSDFKDTIKPRLIFLVRDWGLPDEFPYGDIGGEAFVQRRLQEGRNQHTQQKLREICIKVNESFLEIGGFLLPYPGKVVATSPLYSGQVKDIDEEFLEYVKLLVSYVVSEKKLTPKRMNCKYVKGKDMLVYIDEYVKILNKGDYITLETAVEATAAEDRNSALNKAYTLYKEKMEKLFAKWDLVSLDDLKDHHILTKKTVLKEFTDGPRIKVPEHEELSLMNLEKKIEDKYPSYEKIAHAKATADRNSALNKAYKLYQEEMEKLFAKWDLVSLDDLKDHHILTKKTVLKEFTDGPRIKVAEHEELSLMNLEKKIEDKYPSYEKIAHVKMQRSDIYAKAKQFYYSKFAPERRNVLQDLASLRDDLQEEERRLAIGNIAYQGVRTVGIGLFVAGIVAAPFTLGGSLVLSGASLAASTSSFAAIAIHKKVKAKKVKERVSKAEQSLRKHEETCYQMYELLRKLNKYLISTGDRDESHFRSLSASLPQDANLASLVATSIGIVLGVGSVLLSIIDLVEIDAGKMSDEATNMQTIIHKLENEDREFRNFFERADA